MSCQGQRQEPAIRSLIERVALFIINHSGGKDSQAMTLELVERVPRRQLLVIHADLPGVDWEGLQSHIDATVFGLPVLVARAGKTFMQMVERRGRFPSPSNRQCTSDLKRDPIAKVIRAYLKTHPEFGGLVDHRVAARIAPGAYRVMVETERRLNFTLSMSRRPLPEITGIAA